MKFHVIVTGSRPTKNGNKFEAMPEENIKFINATLSRLQTGNYAGLYHGMAKGVDTVVNDYAHNNHIRVHQFPAYWFDPTKEGNVDKRAGLFRNEQMVRAALDNAYNKTDEQVLLLAFYNTPNLSDSTGTAHCHDYAAKKGIQTHSYQLPVLKSTPTPVTVQTQTVQEQINPF